MKLTTTLGEDELKEIIRLGIERKYQHFRAKCVRLNASACFDAFDRATGGFAVSCDIELEGVGRNSNPQPSESQSDALTN